MLPWAKLIWEIFSPWSHLTISCGSWDSVRIHKIKSNLKKKAKTILKINLINGISEASLLPASRTLAHFFLTNVIS